jgi:hypothetical protein
MPVRLTYKINVVELKENDELAKNRGKNGHFFFKKRLSRKKKIKNHRVFMQESVFMNVFLY